MPSKLRRCPSSSKRRGFLVDDHPIVRQGLEQLINQQEDLSVCGQADSAQEALRAMAELKPDFAIIDLSLRGVNGIELIKNMKKQLKGVPVLVLSMHDEELYAERALRAGARGYVQKEDSSDKLIRAIRDVLEGKISVSEHMHARIIENIVEGRPTGGRSPLNILSDRELEIFECIGRGRSTREIAKDLHLSVKTIEAHRSNIKRKIKLRSGTELVQRAIQWVQGGRAS